MTKFADYERSMWTWLSYLTVCRYYIAKDPRSGQYMIRKAGPIRLFLYYLLWVNSIVKIVYLILTYKGWLLEVHFLDQMSMWDWFLCFSQLVQETNMWIRKYPLYEVIHANWTIQEEVFRKMGSPREVEDKIYNTCRSLVRMHTAVVFVGCAAIAIQFLFTPKYALNTYAIVPIDTWFLRVVFAIHEYVYIFHIWVHQASSIVLLEVFAVTYTHIFAAMADVMGQLSEEGELKVYDTGGLRIIYNRSKSSDSLQRRRARVHSRPTTSEVLRSHQRFIPDRTLDPKTVAPGTQYTILGLLDDYKLIMIAGREFNVWAGKCMGGTMMSNYGQFVSDVFMMIQLLKEPDTDIMGVFFYFEDACAGMLILIRMLILISRMYPQSELFLDRFKEYLQHESPIRGYLRKYQRTLRIVATKIGGYSTNPTTVPKGINGLMNYYIAAAMWQRPVDPTRRT